MRRCLGAGIGGVVFIASLCGSPSAADAQPAQAQVQMSATGAHNNGGDVNCGAPSSPSYNPNPCGWTSSYGEVQHVNAFVYGVVSGGQFVYPDGGTVTFFDGQTSLGSAPVHAGAASLTITTPLARGRHDLYATYSGYGEVSPGQSNTYFLLVRAAPPPRTFERVSGFDRIETSVALSYTQYGQRGGYDSANAVVLARSDDFADSLAGGAFASLVDAPLLLTPADHLDSRVQAEIQRILDSAHPVYLLGGENALSAAVASAVSGMGYPVHRFAGADRYETAAAIAGNDGNAGRLILLADGENYPDALAASAVANQTVTHDGVILLTAGSTMPAATARSLSQSTNVYAIGGPAAAADPSATPIIGADRYATAALVARHFFTKPFLVGLATGAAPWDALAGGAHIGFRGGPLLLTAPDHLSDPTAAYLTDNRATLAGGFVYGGPAAVSDGAVNAATTAIQ